MQKKQQTSWGSVADWYDKLLSSENSYQKDLVAPKLLAMMHIQKGEHILDLACGQGFFTGLFASLGADTTGADISSELIERAKKHAPASVHFVVSPADNLAWVKAASFDKVTIVLALQNISNLVGTLREVSRVLKPEGKLYIVLNHPAFRVPGKSDWGYDTKNKIQYRRVDQYLSERMTKIDMHPGEKNPKLKQYTISFHRPLSSYMNALSQAGLSTIGLEEWISHKKSQAGPRQKSEDIARKEIPLFMAIEAKK